MTAAVSGILSFPFPPFFIVGNVSLCLSPNWFMSFFDQDSSVQFRGDLYSLVFFSDYPLARYTFSPDFPLRKDVVSPTVARLGHPSVWSFLSFPSAEVFLFLFLFFLRSPPAEIWVLLLLSHLFPFPACNHLGDPLPLFFLLRLLFPPPPS